MARNCQTTVFERRLEELSDGTVWLMKQKMSKLGFLGLPLKNVCWERV